MKLFYMNVEINFIRNQILLQFFIVNNYFLYLLNANNFIIIFNTVLIFIFFFNTLIDNVKKRLFFIKATIIIYSIISLGSPLIEWDARGIWLFHAKRIFFDENVYAQLDNYIPKSHNDYPVLVASLSASLANLINGWNEIFPKFANVLLMTSPFLFLSSILKNKFKELLFVFIIFFIMGKRIIVGEMDMLQSTYFILNIICLGLLLFHSSKNLNKYIIFYTILNLLIYSHLRPESYYISILIFLSALLINFFKENKINFSIFIYLIISFIPIFYWKYLVANSSIISITNELFTLNLFYSRIFDFNFYFKIFELLFYSKNAIISIIFLAYFIFSFLIYDKENKLFYYNYNLLKQNPIAIYLLCMSFIYFVIIFISIFNSIYAYDMLVEIGRFRYNLPVSLALCYGAMLCNYKN